MATSLFPGITLHRIVVTSNIVLDVYRAEQVNTYINFMYSLQFMAGEKYT